MGLWLPNQKPPRGSQLNRAHPLARELSGVWVLNETTGHPINLLTQSFGELLNGAIWVPGGVQCNANNNSIDSGLNGNVVIGKVTSWVIGFQQNATRALHDYFLISSAFSDFSAYWTSSSNQWTIRGGNSYLLGTLGVWDYNPHNIAFLIDNRNPYLQAVYVDGRLSGSSTSDPNIKNIASTSIYIGGRPDATSRFCGGIVQYALQYDRLLSADEITWLHRDPYAMFKPTMGANIMALRGFIKSNFRFRNDDGDTLNATWRGYESDNITKIGRAQI